MKKIKLSIILIFITSFNLFGRTTAISQIEVQQIFNQLTTVVGDYSQTLPKIVIRPQKRFGASYRRSENTIFIEQAAIDICATFEEDANSAVAFLLGHELTHYYQKHDWQETGFTTGFLTPVATFQQHIHHEKEADTYSAFITHLAGYNSVKILPQLLEKIYDAYDLKGKILSGYPTLSERKALANDVCKTVQNLIDIHQAANYLYALGNYEAAMVSYEYLLKYVKYKELYNNIGLCALYTALPIIHQEHSFIYPLTLDPTIPLRKPGGFTKDALLRKAINHFSIATNYDNSYFISYLHLICAYDLNGQYQEVIPLISTTQKLASNFKEQQQLKLMKGISAFRNGHTESATRYFSTVSKDKQHKDLATIAIQNLQITQGETLIRHAEEQFSFVTDKIEGVSLLFFENQNKKASYPLRDTPLDKKMISIEQLPQSKIYIFDNNGQLTKIQIAIAATSYTSKNIGKESTLAQIEEAYTGVKQQLVTHLNGFYLLIPSKGLLFDLNELKQVTQWGVYIN